MRAEDTDVTLTFPCDPRFVDTLCAAVFMAVTSVGGSQESGQAAARAVETFVEPDLAVPQAPPVVVEVTGTRARMWAGSRHLTVDL
jgi:hypothetical protein